MDKAMMQTIVKGIKAKRGMKAKAKKNKYSGMLSGKSVIKGMKNC